MGVSVLFVCLGNICRSPLAEGAMRAIAAKRGMDMQVDSAGTGDWHVGQQPDGRAILVADSKGVDISGLAARQVTRDDFERFDHVVAMERGVLARLRNLAPRDCRAEITLFLDHVPGRAGEDVVDPYYGDADGFEIAWRDVTAGVEALIEKIADSR